MDWLFADGVAPFSLALMLMFGLGIIEIISLFLGFSFSSHHGLPDLHHPDVHVDLDASHSVLGWLQIGRAPLLILLILFLLGFGLSGVILQHVAAQFLGGFSHAGVIAVPSTIIGLYHMNIGGRLVHKYLPKDETQSISKNSFIGQTVTITTGHAQLGQPAEAKFQDQFGQMHYVMIEPDEADYSFNEGSTALIIRQDGEIYRVVPNIDYLLAKTRSQQ